MQMLSGGLRGGFPSIYVRTMTFFISAGYEPDSLKRLRVNFMRVVGNPSQSVYPARSTRDPEWYRTGTGKRDSAFPKMARRGGSATSSCRRDSFYSELRTQYCIV